jgi:hypothetical protein
MPTVNSPSSAPIVPQGFAAALDTSSIITKVESIKQARALPGGSVVGDLHGGLTFSDAIAAALESRSRSGWQEIGTPSGETWTIIVLDV